MEKKVKRLSRLIAAAIVLCMVSAAGLQAHAEDAGTLGVLHTVAVDAEVRETADTGAAVLGELKAGTPVIVESEDGAWSKVLYQELEGYVESDALSMYGGDGTDSLAQEMGGVAEDEQRFVEEAELAAKQRRTSLIWGIVIGVLILVIFGVGVVSAVKNTKEDEEDEDENEEEDGAGQDEEAEESETEDMNEGEVE